MVRSHSRRRCEKKYGLKPGDEVVFEDTGDGIRINTKLALVNQMLDEIGDALKEKGLTFDEIMARGRAIRGQLIEEVYGLDASDD